MKLTQTELKDRLYYNPSTGIFIGRTIMLGHTRNQYELRKTLKEIAELKRRLKKLERKNNGTMPTQKRHSKSFNR